MADHSSLRPLPPVASAALRNLFVSATEIDAALLIRDRSDFTWDADTLGRALRLQPSHAAAVLQGLADRRLVRPLRSGYRYDPATHQLRAAIDQIAALRPGDRVAAIALVFSRASEPVRDFG